MDSEMTDQEEDVKTFDLGHKDPEFSLYKLLNVSKEASANDISKWNFIEQKRHIERSV